MRVKTAYHADSENAEWTAQRDPTDPRETKTILKKEKKIPDEPLTGWSWVNGRCSASPMQF